MTMRGKQPLVEVANDFLVQRDCFDYVQMGNRIRNARKAKVETQTMCAKAIGLSTSFFGHIERGTRKASLETLISIALHCGVSLDYLALGREPEANVPSRVAPITKEQYTEISGLLGHVLRILAGVEVVTPK